RDDPARSLSRALGPRLAHRPDHSRRHPESDLLHLLHRKIERRDRETERRAPSFSASSCGKGWEAADHSPYGTQLFFTCVACCRNHRPSACAGLNQSYAWPSLVHTCFMLPIDAVRTNVASSLLRKHQTASMPSCSASVLANSAGFPATRFTTPSGTSLVSRSW